MGWHHVRDVRQAEDRVGPQRWAGGAHDTARGGQEKVRGNVRVGRGGNGRRGQVPITDSGVVKQSISCWTGGPL